MSQSSSPDFAGIRDRALTELSSSGEAAAKQAWRNRYLGRQGEVQKLLDGLKTVPAAERPTYGKSVNELRQALEQAWDGTPDPKWVVALGDCAVDGGVFKGSYAVLANQLKTAGLLHPAIQSQSPEPLTGYLMPWIPYGFLAVDQIKSRRAGSGVRGRPVKKLTM